MTERSAPNGPPFPCPRCGRDVFPHDEALDGSFIYGHCGLLWQSPVVPLSALAAEIADA